MSYSFIFHGNLQYAELSKSEIPEIIERSYEPTIDFLLDNEIKFALNITGYTLKYLPDELLNKIGDGIEEGLIELTGTSYTHAILPLLELDRVAEQVREDKEKKEELFGVEPDTFWLPELAYDPILPGILKKEGYEEVYVDGEAVLFSDIENTAMKDIEPTTPHLYKAQRDEGVRFINYLLGLREAKRAVRNSFSGKVKLDAVEEMTGIPVWTAVNNSVMMALADLPLMSVDKVARWISGLDELMLYGMDIEFMGYRKLGGNDLRLEKLGELISRVGSDIVLPSELQLSDRKSYLRTSSWTPDKSLDIWREDEDNRRLNMLSRGMSGENAFLAENSDARGWEPIPERKLDAFEAVYEDWEERHFSQDE
ncbi:MAG: hydrolase [Candidatus Saliniplasma sp.]